MYILGTHPHKKIGKSNPIRIVDKLNHDLTGAKRREWMGCWGLLGLLLLVIMDHSLIPCVSTSKFTFFYISIMVIIVMITIVIIYTYVYIYTYYSNHYMGLSENSVPLHPMVLLIIIPTKWLFHFQTYPYKTIYHV